MKESNGLTKFSLKAYTLYLEIEGRELSKVSSMRNAGIIVKIKGVHLKAALID